MPLLVAALAACSDPVGGPGAADHEQLLFLSTRDAGASAPAGQVPNTIYRMNADGSDPRNVAGEAVPHYRSLALSRDGRKVAYSRLGGCYSIWVMNADGTQLAEVASFAEFRCTYMPRLSPDARYVAFTSTRERVGWEIYIMDANGANPRNVTHPLELSGSNWPAGWTPDGRLVFHHMAAGEPVQTWIVNADGSGRQRFLDPDGDRAPVWSPDGGRVAFISERSGSPRLHVMNADGSAVRRLSELDGADVLMQPGNIWENETSPWSPDGTRLVFRNVDNGVSRLYIVNVDGTGLRPLTEPNLDARFNGWSHSGDWLAFTSAVGGRGDIYVIRPDGTGMRNLTSSSWDDSHALWLPRR